MKNSSTVRPAQNKTERGQTLPMLILMIVVVILFVGLGLDLGFAYLTRASLSKAVDAACMTGVRNLSKTQAIAQQLAVSTFYLNYTNSGVSARDITLPVPTANFTTEDDNLYLDVAATTQIRTFFIRVIPPWSTLQVSAQGRAIRPKVVMSMVLDRSGSMQLNGGEAALPPSVATFIDFFDDTIDRAGMTSFASDARTNGSSYYISIRQPFRSSITNAANAMPFGGGTFSQGGLTNALVQLKAVTVATGEEVIKVCVFFTDGWANIVQDGIFAACGFGATLNFGGQDVGNCVRFFNPSNGNWVDPSNNGVASLKPNGNNGCGSFCPALTVFTSAIDGQPKAFNRANVRADAERRAVLVANDMRANGIIVYSIGLGNSLNPEFLKEVANDPTVLNYSPTDYDGEAVFAPTSVQLQQVFADVANKILLRLTR